MKNFMKKIFFKCCGIYRNLCVKYPFLDKIALRLYYIPRLNRKIKNVKHIRKDYQLNKYFKLVDECVEKFELKDTNRNIYIYLVIAGAGDPSYIFIFLQKLLKYWSNNHITIICDKKFIDILSLYKKYFDISLLPIKNPIIEPETFEDLPLYLKTIIKYNDGIFFDLLKCNCNNLDTFIISNGEYGRAYQHVNLLSLKIQEKYNIDNNVSLNSDFIYRYNKINHEKIDFLLNNYSYNGKIVLCNFESKTLSCGNYDGINFQGYINKLNDLSIKYGYKFIVNSVYNNEKLFKDDNILITRLNFQEIIWLAENNKINLFISERNGLNDVFFVFYSKINQIIFYPSNYLYWVNKIFYDKKYSVPSNLCINYSEFWEFPRESENIVFQGLRNDFINIIDNLLLKYY